MDLQQFKRFLGLGGNKPIVTSGTLTLTGAVTEGAEHTLKTHAAFAGSGVKSKTGAVQTTDATADVVVTGTEITLADGTLGWVRATVAARDEAGTERAMYCIMAQVHRQGAGAVVGASADVITAVESDAALDCTIEADGANAVRVEVTGKAATVINWVALVEYQIVGGNE